MYSPARIAERAHALAPALACYLETTPLEERDLDGRAVLLKREDLLPTGSFKVRGALARLLAVGAREQELVTCSAGNFGLGAAHAAELLGLDLHVFVPADAARVKSAGIRALGAVLHRARSRGYDDAEREARAFARRAGLAFLSPFDDELVIAGNGTLALELAAQAEDLGAVFCPVGGGGLAGGVGAVLRATAPGARLIGAQSVRTRAMHDSLAQGRAITRVPPCETLADGLEGGVAQGTWRLARELELRCELVTEEEIGAAIRLAGRAWDIVVEGAAAAAIALARRHSKTIAHSATVVIVISGGNIDPQCWERINRHRC